MSKTHFKHCCVRIKIIIKLNTQTKKKKQDSNLVILNSKLKPYDKIALCCLISTNIYKISCAYSTKINIKSIFSQKKKNDNKKSKIRSSNYCSILCYQDQFRQVSITSHTIYKFYIQINFINIKGVYYFKKPCYKQPKQADYQRGSQRKIQQCFSSYHLYVCTKIFSYPHLHFQSNLSLYSDKFVINLCYHFGRYLYLVSRVIHELLRINLKNHPFNKTYYVKLKRQS
eukprot:TRINITY_DN313_c2_g1_i3.p1 TRINITY_DN313_c2_g1~~TRINITY_DN313_c2_g1_i3.p1  ORF type:complete len:228 (+),score=-32.01 TRINITY_DN313_c2_g1_i3:306-989(+)